MWLHTWSPNYICIKAEGSFLAKAFLAIRSVHTWSFQYQVLWWKVFTHLEPSSLVFRWKVSSLHRHFFQWGRFTPGAFNIKCCGGRSLHTWNLQHLYWGGRWVPCIGISCNKVGSHLKLSLHYFWQGQFTPWASDTSTFSPFFSFRLHFVEPYPTQVHKYKEKDKSMSRPLKY